MFFLSCNITFENALRGCLFCFVKFWGDLLIFLFKHFNKAHFNFNIYTFLQIIREITSFRAFNADISCQSSFWSWTHDFWITYRHIRCFMWLCAQTAKFILRISPWLLPAVQINWRKVFVTVRYSLLLWGSAFSTVNSSFFFYHWYFWWGSWAHRCLFCQCKMLLFLSSDEATRTALPRPYDICCIFSMAAANSDLLVYTLVSKFYALITFFTSIISDYNLSSTHLAPISNIKNTRFHLLFLVKLSIWGFSLHPKFKIFKCLNYW